MIIDLYNTYTGLTRARAKEILDEAFRQIHKPAEETTVMFEWAWGDDNDTNSVVASFARIGKDGVHTARNFVHGVLVAPTVEILSHELQRAEEIALNPELIDHYCKLPDNTPSKLFAGWIVRNQIFSTGSEYYQFSFGNGESCVAVFIESESEDPLNYEQLNEFITSVNPNSVL